MTRRAAFTLGLSLGALAWLVLAACDPPPAPGEIPPASVDTAGELNAYMISHPITDLDGRTVDINDGAVTPPTGATLLNGTLRRTTDSPERAFRHIQITADDVTLDGLTIEGVRTHDPHYGLQPVYDPTREAQHGISIEGADHTRVTDVAVTNVYGDGIYIRGGAVDTIITNPTINLVGRTSITNVHSTGTRTPEGTPTGPDSGCSTWKAAEHPRRSSTTG